MSKAKAKANKPSPQSKKRATKMQSGSGCASSSMCSPSQELFDDIGDEVSAASTMILGKNYAFEQYQSLSPNEPRGALLGILRPLEAHTKCITSQLNLISNKIARLESAEFAGEQGVQGRIEQAKQMQGTVYRAFLEKGLREAVEDLKRRVNPTIGGRKKKRVPKNKVAPSGGKA